MPTTPCVLEKAQPPHHTVLWYDDGGYDDVGYYDVGYDIIMVRYSPVVWIERVVCRGVVKTSVYERLRDRICPFVILILLGFSL